MQSLTLGKKSQPAAEYAPSLRSPWRASKVLTLKTSVLKLIAILFDSR
ncbi:hypothetical protein [Candidiatus Paracoxiella cheracis]